MVVERVVLELGGGTDTLGTTDVRYGGPSVVYPGLKAVVVRSLTAPFEYRVLTVVESELGPTVVTPVGTSTTLALGGGT